MNDRAVVAISEDRQWLVALSPTGRWIIAEWGEDTSVDYECVCGEGWIVRDWNTNPPADTGQSADAVLADFLTSKED